MLRLRNAALALSLALAAAIAGAVAGAPANAASVAEKVALQAAMQRHIDQQSIDGVYLHMDVAGGEVHKLYPLTAHPKVMQMGEHFVLCFDFKDEAGKKVDVDFYMARKGKSYVVFHQTVNDHSLIGRLMSTGKITN
jgi:hypothetical protein